MERFTRPTRAFGIKSHYSVILFMVFRIVVYPLHGRCPYIWQCSRGKVLSECESHATGYCSALLGFPALETSRPPALRSDLPAGHTCTAPPFQSDPENTKITSVQPADGQRNDKQFVLGEFKDTTHTHTQKIPLQDLWSFWGTSSQTL